MATAYLVECAVCGKQAERAKPAKYCSTECKERAKSRRRAGSPGGWRSGRHSPKTKQCRACSASFVVIDNSGKRFCSPTCREEWDAVPRVPVSFTLSKFRCQECEARFVPAQSNSRFCSLRCSQVASQKERTAGSRGERQCPECGVSFIPPYGRAHSSYCSNECAHRSNRRVRRKIERARLRSAKVEAVNPTKVFERDGWRCHLCGCKTPRRLRGSFDDRAPELDHIVPLSQGGEHSYRNTACACRKCNGAKADSSKGQLLLFG